MAKFKLLLANRKTKDMERAVLPTILFARKQERPVTVTAITIGWWAWGIGLMITTVKGKRNV